MISCQVLNFTDGQIIDYRIVILRGIFTYPSLSPIRLINKSAAQENEEPASTTSLENENVAILNCVEDQVEVEIGRHLFVALAQLIVGKNELSLCDSEHNEHFLISLFYQPKVSSYQVRGLLIQSIDSNSNEDTPLIRSYIKRINFALELVQSIFADKLYEFGIPDETSTSISTECTGPEHRTFDLVIDFEGDSIIRIPHTTIELTNMKDIWKIVGKTIRKNCKLWAENVKYVAIMNIEDDGSTLPHLPLDGIGVGGLAILSSNLNRWPTNLKELLMIMTTQEGVGDKEFFMNLAWLGGLTHESGHLFDLGHTSKGLMSNDYYKTKLIFCPRTTAIAKRKQFLEFCQNQSIIENAQNFYFIPKIISKSTTNQIFLSEDSNALNLSAAVILYYHRWFLPSPVCDSGPTLVRNKVFAPNGLCAIEIRELSGLVLTSWTFKSEDTNYITEFTFKRRYFSLNKEKPQIFVQDFKGNSLKMVIDPNSFPEGFTQVKRSK